MFYSERKDKKGKAKPIAAGDGALSDFVTGAKNCRRNALICGMGGDIVSHLKDAVTNAHLRQFHLMTD